MKIVVGGQIEKNKIKDITEKIMGEKTQVDIKNDLDAAMAMKNNEYDYYLGACATGGGGALAMALALVGPEKCSTISMPGNVKSNEFISRELENGKVCFGFTASHIDLVVPELLKLIKNR